MLLGPPGAGKGTLARDIAACSGVSVFVTGDIFRKAIAEKSELGNKIKETVEAGKLVDDETAISLVKEYHKKHPEGILFDGFPRTTAQAKALQDMLGENDSLEVVYLDAPEESIVKRLGARRVCTQCGRIYNLQTTPPVKDDVCDDCGTPLTVRKDDTREVISNRYRIFCKETEPLVEFFGKKLIKIDANRSIDEVSREVRGKLCQA